MPSRSGSTLFFYNAPSTPEIYTLSLHDALPIYCPRRVCEPGCQSTRSTAHARSPRGTGHPACRCSCGRRPAILPSLTGSRSEEHTSELQSHHDLVCRLLLEKKKQIQANLSRGNH